MIPRAWRFAAMGLGLLALSCAGGKFPAVPGLPAAPRGAQEVLQKAQKGGEIVGTITQGGRDYKECAKLKAFPSTEEEYALGGAVALNWVQKGGGLISDDEVVKYLNVVGRNLGAQSSRPTLRWTFGVLQSEESINALSTPGGYIFVTRKLLKSVDNEVQLAGVLAHEIAHVTERHVLHRYDDVKVDQCKHAAVIKSGKQIADKTGVDLTPKVVDDLLGVVNTWKGTLNLDEHVDLLGSFTDDLVGKLVNKGLDEKEEFDADEQAVRLLVSAGYDPKEYIAFLGRLPEGGKSGFAHHPSNKDRQARLRAFLLEKPPEKGFTDFDPSAPGLVTPPLPPKVAAMNKTAARDKP